MRTVALLFLCVFVLFPASLHAADALEGEENVVIPPNVTFDISRNGETGWTVDIGLDARYYYGGVMGEAIYNFATKMTMNGITASQALTYTDPKTGYSVSAPTVFRPGDAILDELGAREEFEEIKLLKAYFSVSFGGLQHLFMDQEVFAPSGEWGTNLGTSLPDWNAFFYGAQAGVRSNFGMTMMSVNNYSPDEIETVKKAYADALRSGSQSCLVTLLTEPKPQFSGLIEFENAVLSGLREKAQKEKSAITADDLKAAFGGERDPAPEPNDGYDVSAADLKQIFGGTAVPIAEMGRASGDVTADDLKKAFAQIPGEEPAKHDPVDSSTGPERLTLDCGNGVKLEMARIPAGTFMMGSPESEEGRDDDEVQHQVTISKAFYMGVYEVTQAQYQAVMGTNPSRFQGASNPVEQVSWDEAMMFCRKLSEKTGRKVRLPTEAGWEYACRAGTTTMYYNGNDPEGLAHIDNVADESAMRTGKFSGESISSNDGFGETTAPVGRFQSNEWDLHDMHGNVSEWCSDGYGEYSGQSSIDPQGASNGSFRVVRGGAWDAVSRICRSSTRRYGDSGYRSDALGFRVSLDN